MELENGEGIYPNGNRRNRMENPFSVIRFPTSKMQDKKH